MIILVPMGGKGIRFKNAGYTTEKPSIIITDRKYERKIPMIIGALNDLPGISDVKNPLICIDKEIFTANGTESEISNAFPKVQFLHDHESRGQGQGCLLAQPLVTQKQDILIGASDCGIDFNDDVFQALSLKADVIVFTHTGDLTIDRNPNAHSWLEIGEDSDVKKLSLKKPVSLKPLNDHATTGIFWYRDSDTFFNHLEQICLGSSQERYIDEVVQFSLEAGLKVKFMDVDYYCWGTPEDLEAYENTVNYWSKFRHAESWLK